MTWDLRRQREKRFSDRNSFKWDPYGAVGELGAAEEEGERGGLNSNGAKSVPRRNDTFLLLLCLSRSEFHSYSNSELQFSWQAPHEALGEALRDRATPQKQFRVKHFETNKVLQTIYLHVLRVDRCVVFFRLFAKTLKHSRWLHTRAWTGFDENLICWGGRRYWQLIIKIYQQPVAKKKKEEEGRQHAGLWSQSSLPKLSRCYNPWMIHSTLRELWLWAIADINLTFHWLTEIKQRSLR